jgi:lipid-binding SYLF domain-containing protein
MGGIAVGADIGAENTDMLIVLKTEKAVERFMSGAFSIGLNGCLAFGTVGRSIEGTLHQDQESIIFSFSKGLYGGVSMEFTGIRAWRKRNKQNYTHLRDKENITVSDFADKTWCERPSFAKGLHTTLDGAHPIVSSMSMLTVDYYDGQCDAI